MSLSTGPAREFERLRRALSSVEPGSLIVVTLTHPDERRRLEDRLSTVLEDMDVGSYDYSSEPDDRQDWNPARLLRDAATSESLRSTDVLLVVGLESRLDVGVGTANVQGLTDLNSAREFLTTLDRVLVLVVSPDFADIVARYAPDIWSWRLFTISLDGLWPAERDFAVLSRRLFGLFKLGPSLRGSLEAERDTGGANARALLAWDATARGDIAAARVMEPANPFFDYLSSDDLADLERASAFLKVRLDESASRSFFERYSAAVGAAWIAERMAKPEPWRYFVDIETPHVRQQAIVRLTVAILLLSHGRAERALAELPTLEPSRRSFPVDVQAHAVQSDASRLLGRRRLPDGSPLGPSFDELNESAQGGVLPW